MQTLVMILMLVIGFNFLLKQSFRSVWYVAVLAVLSALFVGLLWPVAIEQSKMQIASWLANPALMLDTSVLLTVDVALQMWFCIVGADRWTGMEQGRAQRVLARVLDFFPGLLFFGVLFSLLVMVIFSFPGVSFALLGWGFAAVVLIALPLGIWAVKAILPEENIRLELLFLSNALAAVLGVVATVNGRTATQGTSEVNWLALAAMLALLAVGLVCGVFVRKISFKRKYKS